MKNPEIRVQAPEVKFPRGIAVYTLRQYQHITAIHAQIKQLNTRIQTKLYTTLQGMGIKYLNKPGKIPRKGGKIKYRMEP
jgi:hypothetical protein